MSEKVMVESNNEKIDIKDLKSVLTKTGTIIKHNNELTIAKGEHFNLFSVLKIETRENNTHSAFLAELLNPKGSHLMDDVFLKLFLNSIKHNDKFEPEDERKFNTSKAFVKVEHSVGSIDLHNKPDEDPSKATGGRIDIYLKDKNENIISIENKIHADDQEAQIQRYCNHETHRNTVYYLTLKGDNPTEYSSLNLEADKDFYNISYRDDIIDWLELCLKEVPNFTGLRESINQYILLIKKLTHILNKQEQKALKDTIVNNLEESKFIADNYPSVVNDIREGFREDLVLRLQDYLGSKIYSVKSDLSIYHVYSKIWIHFKDRKDIPFSYCVEPFSGRSNGHDSGRMFVGLYGHDKAKCEAIENPTILNDVWQHVHWLKTAKGNNLHLNSVKLLKALYNQESSLYKNLVDEVFNQIVEFIEKTNIYILKNVDIVKDKKI
ncbi:PD-(D/E)XK nuclease family protein [Psychroserpens sp. AS72]|uniref:PDDEXK-like family protein n=1 Tax=Psychroserpens sp. AS72 TaxID=3135775 RepID=UPI00317F7A4B